MKHYLLGEREREVGRGERADWQVCGERVIIINLLHRDGFKYFYVILRFHIFLN